MTAWGQLPGPQGIDALSIGTSELKPDSDYLALPLLQSLRCLLIRLTALDKQDLLLYEQRGCTDRVATCLGNCSSHQIDTRLSPHEGHPPGRPFDGVCPTCGYYRAPVYISQVYISICLSVYYLRCCWRGISWFRSVKINVRARVTLCYETIQYRIYVVSPRPFCVACSLSRRHYRACCGYSVAECIRPASPVAGLWS